MITNSSQTLKIKIPCKNSSNGKLVWKDENFRGITDKNLKYAKYRFNQSFHLIGADNFLKDLFNDKNVLNTFEPLSSILSCSGVKY